MKGKYRIGTVSGIGIHLHWTLLILFVWLFGLYMWRGHSPQAAFTGVGLVAALFGCVVLHELGHSLTAKRFGIHTQHITLYPFGGIAMLGGREMKPREELWVALAGPAVNLAIAGVLFILSGMWQVPRAFDAILLPARGRDKLAVPKGLKVLRARTLREALAMGLAGA
ncbi:MAG: site-2 protease family protein [Rhodothermales bacterium]|nr:site-2 protease family protein [Rhodothermales bacterium]